MSMTADEDQVRARLEQLRCHFTWKLHIVDTELSDLENRVFDEIEFLDTKFNVGIHNLLAYVKHLNGQNKEALESLKEAEDLMQAEHADQSDALKLVTWGNYAWLYYHMDRLADAQIYLDKVENMCKKCASPSCYTMEYPEMDCAEGWALLKCGGKNYERAKACFEKALEVDPENPEFNTGYAIVVFRLDGFHKTSLVGGEAFCVQPLKRAIRLNPEDAYIKALLAVKLQELGKEAEGEKYVEEALANMSSQTYVFRYAAKFYRKKGSLDKALHLLKNALRATPSSAFLHHQIGLCYRSQVYQISKATKWQPRGWDRENIDRITKLAISHLEFAVEQKPTFEIAYIHLADMYIQAGNNRKAEDTFQKLLCMKPIEETMQEIYYRYGRFQEFQRKSEVDAIIYYLKAIKIEKPSPIRDRTISSLEKVVLKKLQRNAVDIESLSILGFTYKLKGEMDKALEYYERALRQAADSENAVAHAP